MPNTPVCTLKQIISLSIFLLLINGCATYKSVIEEKEDYVISVKNAGWELSFPRAGFHVDNGIHNDDGTSSFYSFSEDSSGINVSFMIEPAKECNSAETCRDYAMNNRVLSLSPATEMELKEERGWALIEFLVTESKEKKINEHHVRANFVKDGYWIDLHISKRHYKKSDRIKMIDFIHSVSFKHK